MIIDNMKDYSNEIPLKSQFEVGKYVNDRVIKYISGAKLIKTHLDGTELTNIKDMYTWYYKIDDQWRPESSLKSPYEYKPRKRSIRFLLTFLVVGSVLAYLYSKGWNLVAWCGLVMYCGCLSGFADHYRENIK